MAATQSFSDTDTKNKSILAPQFQLSREEGDDKGPCCAKNPEKAVVKVETCLDEQEKAQKLQENIDVDIMNCTNKGDFAPTDIDDPDATEYSSSFADTSSDTETYSRLSETELDSEFSGGITCTFDTFGPVFKTRKKLTNHWRTFIHPLTWRCKWAELRIKEIDSQSRKYAKELAGYDKWKHLEVGHCTIEECGSKSLPLSRNRYRNKALKRRQRKKVEARTETTSYTSHHNLFSYLENKKSDPEATSLVDDFGNPVADTLADSNDRFGITEDQSTLELKVGENSLEQLLWMMETAQSRINKLKSEIEVVLSRNCSRFSSSENLTLVPYGVQTSSIHSPAFSTCIGDTVSVGARHNTTHHLPECETGDIFLRDSNVSSYREAITIPDIVESTVGLLSATDVSFLQSQKVDSCEDMVGHVFIDNEMAESEGNTLKPVDPPANQEDKEEKGAGPSSLGLSASDPISKSGVPQEQLIVNSSLYSDVHFPKAKRKRAERKAGSGSWSRKCSGEPDSQ